MRVSYVGLGAMGGALARRLLLQKKVNVFDARRDVVEAMGPNGIPMDDLKAVARSSDVIFICLPTSELVRQVVLGENGLLSDLAAGTILLDQTTGDPVITREISQALEPRGVIMMDAPVSGGPRGADAGTIGIYCGGPKASYDKILPLLELISPNIVYCGDVGNGHVAKLVNNASALANRVITYEGATLAVSLGLSLKLTSEVVNTLGAWNGASHRVLPALATATPSTNFQTVLAAKDQRLASALGKSCGAPMIVSNVVCGLTEAAVNEVGGTSNLDDMARAFEKRAGIIFADAQ